MRAEKLQLVVDAVGLGKLDGAEFGKKNIMPSSYTGGRRYMTENFHDAVAVSRVHASPGIFTTFTCNPKWLEITESLEPGQKAVDRTDITVRVHHMKLLEYLRKIRTGKACGYVVAVLHTMEFQKRGLPHAHILVWQEKDDDRVVTPALINSFISATGSELTDVDADAPATAPAKTMENALAEPPKLKRATATAAKTVSSKKLKE